MTQAALALAPSDQPGRSISPFLEMGAYEQLWVQQGASFKRLADKFREQPDALPSDLVPAFEATKMAEWVRRHLQERDVRQFGIRIHRGGEYPQRLRDAKHPVELLYYRGIWETVEAPCVAVVGTRKPTREGVRRCRKLTRLLVQDGWTIVSGLAEGIDTVAHTTALQSGGRTIAVIGTPICEVYPSKNRALQLELARHFLVISQVPVNRYHMGNPRTNRFFFPERNVTMSALTVATIVVEASDTSGTRIQARAALQQERKLLILDSCFRDDLKWPWDFEQKGAVRVRDFEQIRDVLPDPSPRRQSDPA